MDGHDGHPVKTRLYLPTSFSLMNVVLSSFVPGPRRTQSVEANERCRSAGLQPRNRCSIPSRIASTSNWKVGGARGVVGCGTGKTVAIVANRGRCGCNSAFGRKSPNKLVAGISCQKRDQQQATARHTGFSLLNSQAQTECRALGTTGGVLAR